MVLDSKTTAFGTRDDVAEAQSYLDRDALSRLSDNDLLDLYESLNPDIRDYLEGRYRALKKKTTLSNDADELKLIQTYLDRYQYEGLVPTGDTRWVKFAGSQRQAIQKKTTEDVDYSDYTQAPSTTLRLIALVSIFIISIMALFMLPRLLSASDEVILTASPTSSSTATPEPTQTASPTALALNNSDAFVRAGDSSNRDFYPVFLDVQLPDVDQPRVFVVQERSINTTEWLFEPHPDVASWISGTVIRPVLGIPFSESNASFIDSIVPGTIFTLRTNTGSDLQFTFSESQLIERQETHFFRQLNPGFVLTLLGETDDSGLPSATRPIIIADYNSTQEMENVGGLFNRPVQPNIGQTVGDIDIMVRDMYLVPLLDDAQSQFVYAMIDLELNSSQAIDLASYQWFLEDRSGIRYSSDLSALLRANYDAIPASVSESVNASIGFLVSRYTRDAQLLVSSRDETFQAFTLNFESPGSIPTVEQLTMQIRNIQRDARHIYVDLRFYNALDTGLTVQHDDISLAFGFQPNPIGLANLSTDWQGTRIEPGQEFDVSLTFSWNGRDPYASLMAAGRVYSISIIDD